MIKRFFSPDSLWLDSGLALIRIMVGLFMIYHGSEVFNRDMMSEYVKRLSDLHFQVPAFMAYIGKSTELITGILFVLGLFTRMAAVALIITMCIIAFGMGEGRIFMEEQHPFLFALLALVFFFTGAGRWSFDRILFGGRYSSDI
jgi:putative oxidoreductase